MSGQNYDPSFSMLSNKVPSEPSCEGIHAYICIQYVYMSVRLDLGLRINITLAYKLMQAPKMCIYSRYIE